ncbi:hypothetical protein PQC39_gp145 [Vibrio phage Vp_R1]|uniref:DUF2493 domain-containing protein n=1 Tax=Vibrio phage Vp_R1 TaxID=2059867 RepID=A0A2H5BQ94_9CAUD|nr:hypothetical protein PQC39_gp145 [Vibrio phage Vp_R1]AUG88509.1 hypothetical protein VPR_145 [Vibrio phage Vp_R1]
MKKVIIAGGRDFINYRLLCAKVDKYRKGSEVEIVCGLAKGADILGKRYALSHKLSVAEFPANWQRHGKSAGYIRNDQMAQYSDVLLAFWDGKSKGTKHMIDLAYKRGLEVHVFRYKREVLPTVVNKYKEDYDIYIGRGSFWGNPYPIDEDNPRGSTIERYRDHLRDLYRKDKVTFMNELIKLNGKKLGCFCKPQPCHGDVIVDVFSKMFMES